ncbi:MAG: hypothetical protein LBP25_02540 [Tannerellaceae bacterium]|nr:hypothetical protein [Tannerellaceae bacterium]
MRIAEDVKKGQRPTSVADRDRWIILSANYLPNGGLSHIDFFTYSPTSPLTEHALAEFRYNVPVSICVKPKSDSNTTLAASQIGSGAYDFAGDPAKVLACFGSFAGSSAFTSLDNLRLVANNNGITQEVYSRISFATNCYKIVVYGKNRNGKLIGRYTGYSTTGFDFVYWCIDPDDPSFGSSFTAEIP